MAKKYTLHYLNDKEFDRLPYTYAKTAWGAADEKTGNAYVRRTGIRPIDEFVTEHEIAELVAKVSPHEEDGIRYKIGEITLGDLGRAVSTGSSSKDDKQYGKVSETGSIAGPTSGTKTPTPTTTSEQTAKSTGQYSNYNLATDLNTPNKPTTPSTPTVSTPSSNYSMGSAFENSQAQNLGFANTPVSLGGTTSNVSPNLQTVSTTAPSTSNNLGFTPPSSFSWTPSPANIPSVVTPPATPTPTPSSVLKPLTDVFNQSQAQELGTPVSLGGQTSTVTGGTQGLTSTPTSASSATASRLGFETPAVNKVNPLMGTPSASGQGLAPSAKTAFESAKPKGANVPLEAITKAPATPSIQTGGEVSTTQASTGGETSTTPWLDKLFGKDWRQTLLGEGLKTLAGAGISAIGQATAGKPKTVSPTDSALFNDVVQRVQSGAQVQLTEAQKITIFNNYDNQLDQARKNIVARWKATRPGSDIANDSQLREALVELEAEFAEKKAAAVTAAELGLTQTQTEQLSQLAAYDINSLAIAAGVSNQEAAEFKQMMANLGSMVAGGGMGQLYKEKRQ